MKFIVKIDCDKYEFDDADCAITFAGIAKTHYISEKGTKIDVSIILENKEDKKNGMEF